MISPCVNTCRLIDNACVGCGRTKDEIANWSKYDDEVREEKMKTLKTKQPKWILT